jgi:phosphoadenosine phosphosulfate reductase
MLVQIRSSANAHVFEANAALDGAPADEIVAWATAHFGDKICLTTSFADTVMAHLVTTSAPNTEVIFLDTGFHFAETLQTMRDAHARYRLNLHVVRPRHEAADLWSGGTDSCCEQRKVRPLGDALEARGHVAWFSGLRRADSPARADADVVGFDRNGRVKVNPIANWSDDDVARYIAEHDLLVNPLLSRGYASIGCWPCTEPADGRDGRWGGSDKTECGLHL